MGFDAQYLTVNGRKTRYYEAGEPYHHQMILLHGHYGNALWHWEKSMHELAVDYYLMAPDLPGYGETEALPETSLDALVAWFDAFLKQAGVEKPIVIGNSFGGLIARIHAATYPGNIETLILVNGGVIPSVPGFVRFLTQISPIGNFMFNRISKSTTSESGLGSALEQKDLLTPEFIAGAQAEQDGMKRIMRGLSLSPMPEKRNPKIPTLLIWGEEDTVAPIESGKIIHQNIDNSRFIPISNCRHFPHLEEQDIFVAQVKNYLNEMEREKIRKNMKEKKNLGS